MSDVKLNIVNGKVCDVPFISDYKSLSDLGFYPWIVAFKRNGIEHYKERFNNKSVKPEISSFVSWNKFFIGEESILPSLKNLIKYKTFGIEAYTLVLINGKYVAEISDEDDLPFSVYSDGFYNCLIDNPNFLEHRLIEGENVFSSLNSAYLYDGLVLKVAKGEQLDKPIHIISINISDELVCFNCPRIYIELEENAKLDLLESSLSFDNDKFFENRVLQVELKNGAELNHYRFYNNSVNSLFVENDFIECGDMAKYNSFTSSLKSGIVEVNYNFNILNGCEVNSYTSVYSNSASVQDFKANIHHIGSNANSNVDFVGVSDDESKILFKTNLKTSRLLENIKTNQLSKILLLSEKSAGQILPFQNIGSENVSAFHGAVVSGIKKSDLFFLQTRGIDESLAREIIYKSFLLSVFSNVKNSLVFDEFVKFYWDN